MLVSVETLRGLDAPRFFRSAKTRSIAGGVTLPFVAAALGGDAGGLGLTAVAGWAGMFPGH